MKRLWLLGGLVVVCLTKTVVCCAQPTVWNAGISQTFLNVRGSPVVVGQVALNLTQPGRVLVQFDGECISDVGDRIVLAASDRPDWDVNDGNVSVTAASATANRESFSHSRVYDVSAGPQTFYGVAQNYVDEGGSGIASIYGTLKVRFFPSTPGSAFVGMQGISQTFINVRGAPVTVGTVTIQAPSSGRVIAHFDGHCISDVGDRIVLAASDTPDWGVNDGNVGVKAVSATVDSQTFSHSRVYAVAAGSHTFYAVAENYVDESGSGIASIYGTLTIEFVPDSTAPPLLASTGIADTFVNLRGSAVTLATLALQAPTAGDVVVHFDGDCVSDVGDRIVLAASDTPDWGVNDGNVNVTAPTVDVRMQSFSHSRVYHVLAGAQNFYAVAQNYVDESGSGIASIYGTLTAEFFLPVPWTLRAVFVPPSTFKVLVWGPEGGSGRVQRSTDLVHWADWKSITLSTQPLEIIDPDWSTTPYVFYRVSSP